MLRRLKLATMSQNQSPHNPILSALLMLGYTFPDLLQCLHGVAIFENRESPVSVRIMHMVIMFLGFFTDINSVPIQLEHVEQESQVIVSVRMRWL